MLVVVRTYAFRGNDDAKIALIGIYRGHTNTGVCIYTCHYKRLRPRVGQEVIKVRPKKCTVPFLNDRRVA